MPSPKRTLYQMLSDVCQDSDLRQLRDMANVYVRCRRLVEYFTKDIHLSQLNNERINGYIMSRMTKVSRTTINRELQVLKRGFLLYQKLGYITTIPQIHRFREDNARQGFYTHDEVMRIVDHIKPYLKNVVLFAYYTSWRKREILNLKWTDVRDGMIILRAELSKNKEGRFIILIGQLKAIIDEQYEQRSGDYIFHHSGKRIKNFDRAWKAALLKSSLERNRLFHDLRRTAVRNMRLAGIPEKVAMTISGHKTRQVFDRYNIVDMTDIKVAQAKLDTYYSQTHAYSAHT